MEASRSKDSASGLSTDHVQHKTNGSKKRDNWLLVMKPEREDKLCEEMAMRLSVFSLHKTNNRQSLHYCLPFLFFILNYTDLPGVDP